MWRYFQIGLHLVIFICAFPVFFAAFMDVLDFTIWTAVKFIVIAYALLAANHHLWNLTAGRRWRKSSEAE